MSNTKMKERLKGAVIGGLLVGVVAIAVPAVARVAQENITVNFRNIGVAVDGVMVQLENQPFIFDGRTYLPTRDVAEAVGFDVTWDEATSVVHLTSREIPVVSPSYPTHIAPPVTQGNQGGGGQSSQQGHRPQNPAVSMDEAIRIAYADLAQRGMTGAVHHGDSGMDWERGQWVWELTFRSDPNLRGRGYDIEFYINVETGAVVKFEWDIANAP
ncbi:MAG: stalk domain-containing protein [Defluviitaleaceae bacterium]|nr:stalk domain-containing protein [Defluviitaleaceae bacterium]